MEEIQNQGIMHSEAIGEIAVALTKFHKAVKPIKKDQTNPHLKNRYAGLPAILKAIKKPLLDADLTFIQCPIGKYGLETILMHKSGQYFKSRYTMDPKIVFDKGTNNPKELGPQDQGSVITYQKRYALTSILGLDIDDDDDGNAGSNVNGNQNQNYNNSSPKKDDNQERLFFIKQVKKLWSDLLKAGFKTDKKTLAKLEKFIKNIDKADLKMLQNNNNYLALQYKNIGLETQTPAAAKKQSSTINRDIKNLFFDLGYKKEIDQQNLIYGMFSIEKLEELGNTDKNKLKAYLIIEIEKQEKELPK